MLFVPNRQNCESLTVRKTIRKLPAVLSSLNDWINGQMLARGDNLDSVRQATVAVRVDL